MQKKLIAAAVAGLIAVPALAQTNVTISGRLAAGWEAYELSGCHATNSCRNESRVSDQSSRIIFNVNEDLGGGLSAWGQVDYRGALDSGALSAGGNSGMGLAHKSWGKFTIGRWDVHYGEFGAIESNRAGSLQTNLGAGLMSQIGVGMGGVAAMKATVGNGTRTPNLLMWDSPNWNGFTARLAYSAAASDFIYAHPSGAITAAGPSANEGTGRHAKGMGNGGSGDAWTGALRYNNGPWTAGLSHWSSDSEDGRTGFVLVGAAANPATGAITGAAALAISSVDLRGTRAWVGYTFNMGLKVGLGWDRSRMSVSVNGVPGSLDARRHAWMIPVSYSFGPHTIYGKYARAGSMSGSMIAPGTGGDHKATAWSLGYDYAFSKRTSVGIFYTKLSNDSNAAAKAGTTGVGNGGTYEFFALGGNGATGTRTGEDVRQWYIGMAHNF